MSEKRIEALRGLISNDPSDAMSRYMLAMELYKAKGYEDCIEELEAYLKLSEDEGAAYRVLADSLVQVGKKKEAQWALRQGIEAARRYEHAGMADEFEESLRELTEKR